MRRTVYTAIYLELNAKLQMQAEAMSKKVQFLTKGEVEQGHRDHVAGQRQPRLGELVPRGRPAVSGVVARAQLAPTLILRSASQRASRRMAAQSRRCGASFETHRFAHAPQDDGRHDYNGGKFGGGTRRCDAAS